MALGKKAHWAAKLAARLVSPTSDTDKVVAMTNCWIPSTISDASPVTWSQPLNDSICLSRLSGTLKGLPKNTPMRTLARMAIIRT